MLAPLVNAFLHTLVAAMPDFLPMNFIDRMISGSMIFGYVAPAQASMADLYAKEPRKLGEKMAQWGSNFGLGCALGPFIGSRLQGPRSFLASALVFLVSAAYINT